MELWSAARYEVGLSANEFGKLTPRQLGALFDRVVEGRHRDDYRIAMLDALVANGLGAKVTPEDFMPIKKHSRKQTPQEQYEILKALTLAMGGEVAPESSN